MPISSHCDALLQGYVEFWQSTKDTYRLRGLEVTLFIGKPPCSVLLCWDGITPPLIQQGLRGLSIAVL